MPHLNRQVVGTQTASQVFDLLDVSEKNGLSTSNVQRRREKYGPNRLREAQSRPTGEIFIDQFKSGIVVMLVVAVIMSLAFGDVIEAIAIAIVIVINGLIGFLTELKAARSMEALQELGSVNATVHRDGQVRVVPAEELVLGDLVQLDSGDVVTADIRLSEASKLQADESALTGESVPVSKQVEPLENGEVPLAEQKNMVFKGTAITRGSGKGVVVATGMQTELGHISSLVDEAEEEVTPLEKRLDALGHALIWVTVGLAAVVAAIGVGVGTGDVMHHPPRDPQEPVMTRAHWASIVGYGSMIAAAVLTAFALALRVFGLDQQTAVTISFLTLAMARIWHVFNMRDYDAPVFRNDVTRNPWVWAALGLCLSLIFAAVFMPGLSKILRLVRPSTGQWLLILGYSALPLILGQAFKALKLHYHNTKDRS